MKSTGADLLSRRNVQTIFGLKVIKVNRNTFHEFASLYKGMWRHFEDLINEALPLFDKRKLVHYASMFASLSRKKDTNTTRLRNSTDSRNRLRELNLLHNLPDTTIHPTDATLAILATSYAVENLYVPSTISAKVFGHSPFTAPQKGRYPLTSKVIQGISACRTIEKPVGVVLGKDVLKIFNSSLSPEKEYYDLLLVTFDYICTTTICRTGELAPKLNKPGALSSVVTLDMVRIGNT